jgi:hypothetical protein
MVPLGQDEILVLRAAAERAWNDHSRHSAFYGHPLKAAGQCYVTARWLQNRLGGHVARKEGHFFWLSADENYVLDITGDRFPFKPDKQSGWRSGPPLHKMASHPLYEGYEIVPDNTDIELRVERFIRRANRELEEDAISKYALDYAGDAFPGQEPQAADNAAQRYWHDELEAPGGEDEYKFVYAKGQLEISPFHTHDELREHADVEKGYAGPMAIGYASVNMGAVVWEISSNIGAQAIARVLKDYTNQVGWKWGGMTDLEGEPIGQGSEFGPDKKASIVPFHYIDGLFVGTEETMPSDLIRTATAGLAESSLEKSIFGYIKVIDNSIGCVSPLHRGRQFFASTPSGKAALKDALQGLQDWAVDQNISLVGANDNVLKTIEDLEMGNIYSPDPVQEDRQFFPKTHERQPSGTYKCEHCDRLFPTWHIYRQHLLDEERVGDEPEYEGGFPELDMDASIESPHFREQQPEVYPVSSVMPLNEAKRVDGWDCEDADQYVVAYHHGCAIGAAGVKGRRVLDMRVAKNSAWPALMRTLQTYFPELVYTGKVNKVAMTRAGWTKIKPDMWKWAQGADPKDQIEAEIPFIFDVENDGVFVGEPGVRTADIPGKFTPGGIVEGLYERGGKVVIRSLTNMPYTIRHLVELWYHQHPELEVKSVHLEDDEGKSQKLAKEMA